MLVAETTQEFFQEKDIVKDFEEFFKWCEERDLDYILNKTLLSGELGTKYGYSNFAGTSGHLFELESELAIMEDSDSMIEPECGCTDDPELDKYKTLEDEFAYALREYIDPTIDFNTFCSRQFKILCDFEYYQEGKFDWDLYEKFGIKGRIRLNADGI